VEPCNPAALPHVLGLPDCRAALKTRCEDFRVDEVLGFEPSGEGEHYCLLLKKQNLNTTEVAQMLAQLAGVRLREVGYAGMKDKRAITTQWFSVCKPVGAEPDWKRLEPTGDPGTGIEVLKATRNRRKLRRGVHRGNRFSIVLRDLRGNREQLEERLAWVGVNGVPNYFGPQRFGKNGNNVVRALAMFRGELRRPGRKKSLYLSAARSLLFNRVLASRIEQGCWDVPLDGDIIVFNDNRSVFAVSDSELEGLKSRLNTGDVHVTGPLWGEGELATAAKALRFEQDALRGYEGYAAGLAGAGLKQERRALRVIPRHLEWSYHDGDLHLQFSLPSGAFATSVLREFVTVDN
jgi:tRNA pseudouridine13 synthase